MPILIRQMIRDIEKAGIEVIFISELTRFISFYFAEAGLYWRKVIFPKAVF